MPSLRADDSNIFQSNKWWIIAFLHSNWETMVSFFCSVSCQESVHNCFISEFIQSFVGSSTLGKILQGTLEVLHESAGSPTAEDFLQLPRALISPTWITNFESVSTQAIKIAETQITSLLQQWCKCSHINLEIFLASFQCFNNKSQVNFEHSCLIQQEEPAGKFLSQSGWF